MSEVKKASKKTVQYSAQYKAIKKAAESQWPAWKVTVYNASVATSAHAKKVVQ